MESYTVEIFGRSYTIRGIKDREYLEKLAEYVDSQMKNIASATGTVDTLKIAILAAMTIADARFKAEQEDIKAEKDLERSIDALSDQIQMVLSN